MGTSRGMYLELRRPLLLLDPNGMAVNLGRAGQEDYPETPIPAIPYEALNVMPTALGYRSYFQPLPYYRDNPDTEDPTEGLQNINFQDIFSYQTINAYNITIGLAEGGIFAYSNTANATDIDPSLSYWTRIEEVPYEDGIKVLWTRCVLDNLVYMYHQGDNLLYAIMDYAEYQERVANDPDVVEIYSNEAYQFGILAKTPNFLNMAGQVGIFKADNRLGFWDTDGSVSWSSAINKYDFKPDATTFAGNTKFTSVAGSITTIVQSGRGFVIYATASITRIDPASSSERWTSTPVFSKVGVLYPEQVTFGGADTTHYFWATSGGIFELKGAQAVPYESELSQFFKTQGPIIYLKYLAGKFLFVDISQKDVVDSGAQRYGRIVYDGHGNPFVANPPPRFDDPVYNEPFPMDLILQTSGKAPNLGLEDYDPTGEQFPNVDEGEVLLPCFTGYRFVMPGGIVDPELELSWDTSDITTLDTSSWPAPPGWKFVGDDTLYPISDAVMLTKLNHATEFWSYEAGPIVSPPEAKFIDQAGQDFLDILQKSIEDITALSDRFNQLTFTSAAIGTILLPPSELSDGIYLNMVCGADPFPSGGYPLPEPPRPDPYPNTVVPAPTVTLQNIIKGIDFKIEEDGCVIKIIATTMDVIIGETVETFITEEMTQINPAYPTVYEYYDATAGIYYFGVGATATVREIPESVQEVTVFQCEVSGYGYFPYGGFSFRKTHARSIFKPCSPAGVTSVIVPSENMVQTIIDNPPATTLEYDPYAGINPSIPQGFWDINVKPIDEFVPSTPGYPPTGYQFATFGKGVYNPFYPTMVKSFVKDMFLDKWGIYSDAHSLIFDTLPINRSERPLLQGNSGDAVYNDSQDSSNLGAIFQANGAEPIPDTLAYNGLPVLLMNFNNYSKIVYGKIGVQRAGTTRLTGGSFNLGDWTLPGDENFVNVTIRSSLNNADYTINDANDLNINPQVSFNLVGSKMGEVPFTLDGRWFTITLQGNFNLQYISLYGHNSGRLRFPEYNPELPV